MKKKGLIITLSIVGVIVVLAIIVASVLATSCNNFITKQEDVKAAQSTISVQLQRRADLIPNFVESVKGYSKYEQDTLTAVIQARSAVMGADTAKEQAEANAQLDSAIDIWVNAITEAYPELKADQQYVALQDELAGTENRIAIARKDYNGIANDYNKTVRSFPNNIVAAVFGFEQVEYFEADEAANQVPQVSFE